MTWLFLLLLVLDLQSTLWLTASSLSSFDTDYPIAKHGCADRCGNVSVPYPFGISANCYYSTSYEIVCNISFHPPKAILRQYGLEVVEITGWSHDPIQQMIVRTPVARNFCASDGKGVTSIDLRGSPYQFSRSDNELLVWGCSGSVLFKNSTGQIESGCASVCADNFSVADLNTSNCYGVGCCKASLPEDVPTGLDFYEMTLDHRTTPTSSNTCTLVAALRRSHPLTDLDLENEKLLLPNAITVPTVLEWHGIRWTHHLRRKSVYCSPMTNGVSDCSCSAIHAGNPYLPNGCEIRRECWKCKHHCSYNDTTNQYFCEKNLLLKRASVYGFSSGAGSALLILGCYWIYRLMKWRRNVKRKAKNFKRNGGLLLQQQLSSSDGIVEKIAIFTTSDLEKATDNFHESRILGQGGQGTVYKGMLMDGSIVAIKKSVKVDDSQLDQFINEMVILCQVNHRNVVKLLGCCLETEVPLLVYEFIPNGALYQHIHEPTEDLHITWKMRLQIAAESAGALAYLHSSSSAPIYHRDIKSSNILLDEKYRAKISDFGTSRAVNIEQTHVTTRVQGTYGYLDPEYFQSNQFTEKSDVYSFGVVLVELLTGKKSIWKTECEGWKSLAIEFLHQMKNSCAVDIVDAQVIQEGKEDEFIAVANLAKQCLNMNGRLRPTMKEVVRVLDGIRSPNSKERTHGNGKYVHTEIKDSGPPIMDTFFSANGSFPSSSIEDLPPMRPIETLSCCLVGSLSTL